MVDASSVQETMTEGRESIEVTLFPWPFMRRVFNERLLRVRHGTGGGDTAVSSKGGEMNSFLRC